MSWRLNKPPKTLDSSRKQNLPTAGNDNARPLRIAVANQVAFLGVVDFTTLSINCKKSAAVAFHREMF